MREIIKLSQEVIGQIAAGEVVERPAAAIKELVENSIDAGSKNITVEIREGGIRYFRVSDNGHGIPPEQIRMAFERHATSKIINTDDLYHINTLGFRGEALASIAAVAKVTCTTRTAAQEYGICATIENGQFLDIKESASPIGTSIVVEKIFQNTPVRLKFLKKPAYEAAAVADYMMRLILSRPDIAFRFMNDGKTVYRSSGDGKLANAVFCVYGAETLKALQPVHGSMNGLLMDGFVGVNELSKGNRNHQSFYINDRYFQNLDLSHAVEEACKGRVMIGKFPMCILKLQLPSNTVDVNVHPNKLEVRFQNSKAISEAAENIIRDSFSENTLKNAMTGGRSVNSEDSTDNLSKSAFLVETKTVNETASKIMTNAASADFSKKGSDNSKPLLSKENKAVYSVSNQPDIPAATFEKKSAATVREHQPALTLNESAAVYQVRKTNITNDRPIPLKKQSISATPVPVPAEQSSILSGEETAAVAKPNEIVYIGTVFNTYLIFEHQQKVLLVDQHAAHEKILFERYMKQYQGETCSQTLLCPKLVRLSAAEILQQSEWIPSLREAGFVIEPFDEHCVSVYGIPVILDMLETPEILLHEAINEWELGKRNPNSESIRARIAQMACKHAIKGGNSLNQAELKELISQIVNSDTEPYCPHGRPIVVEVSQRDLEKKFKRVQ